MNNSVLKELAIALLVVGGLFYQQNVIAGERMENNSSNGSLCPDNNHPHMIDLGLPTGTLWACCNVGATTPEGLGGYYAWGETQEKNYYFWDTYIHCDGTIKSCHNIGSDISGTKYDVATVKWGSEWVMPTMLQLDELVRFTTMERVKINGVAGRKFTGSNGASIFLPNAGYRIGGMISDVGIYGAYWSSWIDKKEWYGHALLLDWGTRDLHSLVANDEHVCMGYPVRPVRK